MLTEKKFKEKVTKTNIHKVCYIKNNKIKFRPYIENNNNYNEKQIIEKKKNYHKNLINIIKYLYTHTDDEIKKSINTENIITFAHIFKKHNFIKKPIAINYWITKNVKSMYCGFVDTKLSNDTNISHWDTRNLQNIDYIFSNTYIFNQNLNMWITKKIHTMYSSFNNISKWKTTIENWHLKKIEYLTDCFKNSNQNINFETWTYKSIENASKTFKNCKYQSNTFKNWDFNKIKNYVGMFDNCIKLYPLTKNFFSKPDFIILTQILYNNRNYSKYIDKTHYTDDYMLGDTIMKHQKHYKKILKTHYEKNKHRNKKT